MHFPAGGVKKDGPSAGIAITTALISMAIAKPLREKTSMTGEMSLTGKVLKIGGLKEKVLAAKREGIENVIIPEGNRGDWEELPEGLKEGITFHLVDEYKQVMKVAFGMEI
jgi:ATP-dependent Lon protease